MMAFLIVSALCYIIQQHQLWLSIGKENKKQNAGTRTYVLAFRDFVKENRSAGKLYS